MPFSDDLHRAFSRRNLTDYQILKAAEKAYGSKRAVADELGVSVRHVQRLMKQGRERGGRMRTSAGLRQRIGGIYNSPELRRTMTAPRRAQKYAQGARLTMAGNLGPKIGGVDYSRLREMETIISPEGMELIQEAWGSGDDAYATEVMREVIEREYGVPNWNWNDDSDFTMSFT